MGFIKNLINKQISESYKEYSSKIKITEKTDDEPSYKGVVKRKETTFPKDLGEEHPFDFFACEQMYKKHPIVHGAVDKFVDFVVGPGINVTSENEKAEIIIEQWIQDIDFNFILRKWIKDALMKGTGFVELGIIDKTVAGLKVLNANWMYIKRDEKGKLEGYNQYKSWDFGIEFKKSKIQFFKPGEVIHLSINAVGDEEYGCGVVNPQLNAINSLLANEKSFQMLMNRKANAPYWDKQGWINPTNPGASILPSDSSLSTTEEKLTMLKDKTEFVTGPDHDITILDPPNFGEKFELILRHYMEYMFYGFQIPEVLFGTGRLPEGLAKEQKNAFERRIQSMQLDIEKVLEYKLFRRILQSNGIDDHVEVHWGEPDKDMVNEKIRIIQELLKNPLLDYRMQHRLQKELITLFEFEDDTLPDEPEEPISYIPKTPKEEPPGERQKEEETSQPIIPGSNRIKNEYEIEHGYIDENDYSIKEWVGFNWLDYKMAVIAAVKADKFELLLASSQIQLEAGLLTSLQIEQLRGVVEDGFRKEKTINQISDEIDEFVVPGTRYQLTESGELKLNKKGEMLLSIPASIRSKVIARTEIVRLSNIGALNRYKDAGVEKYKWVAAVSDRTCPMCLELNGQIFDINNPQGKIVQPPAHTMCFIDHQIPIYTSKGWKQIGKIEKGDKVLTYKGKFRNVTRILNDKQYNGEVYTITLGYNMQKNKTTKNSITVTPEHPILTSEGWKNAKDITINDKISVLTKECKECGKLFPYFNIYEKQNFCSQSCMNRYTANIQFQDEEQHTLRSIKTKEQMKREYANGTRDKYKITEGIHKKVKELWNDNTWKKEHLEKLKKVQQDRIEKYGQFHSEEGMRKLKDRKGTKNPMRKSKHPKEFWKEISDKWKNYYKEYPEKHPNRTMCNVSKPQLELYYTIKKKFPNVQLEYPLDTGQRVRFLDIAIPEHKIGIQYDGSYWHQDKEKDNKRNKEITDSGWLLFIFNEENYEKTLEEFNRISKNHNDDYKFMEMDVLNVKGWNLRRPRKLYNFAVEDDESYIAKGFVVHNCRCTVVPIVKR